MKSVAGTAEREMDGIMEMFFGGAGEYCRNSLGRALGWGSGHLAVAPV